MSAPQRKSPKPPASKARRTAAAPRPRPAAPKTASFPIVGIGASAGVVVNEDFDIPQFRGHTGPYLEPAAGAGRKKLALNARRIAEDGVKTKAILLAMEETKTP